MRQYFLSIPSDLEEAARIDGAGFFTTFSRVMLPLAGRPSRRWRSCSSRAPGTASSGRVFLLRTRPLHAAAGLASSARRRLHHQLAAADGHGRAWRRSRSSSCTSSSSATSSRGSRPVASRAEAPAAPDAAARTALRLALTDFYFNSCGWSGRTRLGRGRGAWRVLAGMAAGGASRTPLLALPTVGIFCLAASHRARRPTTHARGDLRWAYGRAAGGLLLVGCRIRGSGHRLRVERRGRTRHRRCARLAVRQPRGLGLVATWCVALVLWPILADPQRPNVPSATTFA